MKFDDVYREVKGVPFITKRNARFLYDFIVENRPARILELGFAHGTASCVMAAALEEIGEGGKLVSVDLEEAKEWQSPSIEQLLERTRLSQHVEIYRMQTGYNWFLRDEIRRNTSSDGAVCTPVYDLVIIDGPKNWTIDSSAFFLADKLLKTNGWIFFDDYNWSYAEADSRRDETDGITHRKLSDEERTLPHVREIFQLLVMQHPSYSNFIIQQDEDADWAMAQKHASESKSVELRYTQSYRDFIVMGLYKLKNRLLGKK